jgi:hypothetical protein
MRPRHLLPPAALAEHSVLPRPPPPPLLTMATEEERLRLCPQGS